MSIRAAGVLAGAIVLAALLHGGLYIVVPASIDKEPFTYRVNRWTGRTDICRRDIKVRWAIACAPAWESSGQH